MFEKAARLQLRFDSKVGAITVEDLWALPLTSTTGKVNLNEIAIGLYNELKDVNEVSFVTPKVTDGTLQLKFDIVKHIIDVVKEENAAAALATANKAKKQQILGLIEQKQTEALAGTSLEDLQALADSL